MEFEVERMEPLFRTEEDYKEFTERHNGHCVKRGDLSTYKGKCFLGIDAGSTTTKVALVAVSYTHLDVYKRQRRAGAILLEKVPR